MRLKFKKILKKIRKGFTLIELLVVIAVIALLSSVVLVAVNTQRQKARDDKRMADISQLAKAFELFFNDKKSYPTTGLLVPAGTWGVLHAPPAGFTCTTSGAGCVNYLIPAYILAKIPAAPEPPDGPCGSTGYAGGTTTYNDYQYLSTAGGAQTTTYFISFCLGEQVGSLAPGPHTLTSGGIR